MGSSPPAPAKEDSSEPEKGRMGLFLFLPSFQTDITDKSFIKSRPKSQLTNCLTQLERIADQKSKT